MPQVIEACKKAHEAIGTAVEKAKCVEMASSIASVLDAADNARKNAFLLLSLSPLSFLALQLLGRYFEDIML